MKRERTNTSLFAYNLKQIMTAQRLSQEELAKKIDVSQGTVSGWCQGNRLPRLDEFELLCSSLECSPEDLLSDGISSDLRYGYALSQTIEMAKTCDSETLEVLQKIIALTNAKREIPEFEGSK